MMKARTSQSTSLALHNLRGFAILNVILFHSIIAYIVSQPASPLPFDVPPYDWRAHPIVDADRWLGFDLICAFEFLCLMQLMFFLSGLFVWPSLTRKGAKTFLLDRLLRIGVPLAAGTIVLMPLAYYPVYRVTAVDPSWSAFWTHWLALPFWPGGPMWFLWFLLALNFAAAAVYRLAPRAGEWLSRLARRGTEHPGRFFLGLASVSAAAYVPLAALYTPWEWVVWGPFGFQPALAPQYVLYFVAGLAVGAHGFDRGLLGPNGRLVRRWGYWLAGMGGAFLLWLVTTALIVKGQAPALPAVKIAADLGFVLFGASACFGLAAVFLRFAAGRRPLLDGVSEHAYGIYWVHYVFVIWTQYLLLGIALPGVLKGMIVFTVTLALSWGASAGLGRLPLAARVIGAPGVRRSEIGSRKEQPLRS
jgi:glucans biosynthesis protein C